MKKPGNPRNGRRLHGVPKAGPLYVNGIETPKGNVHKAVSSMYRTASRTKADTPGELAVVQVGQAHTFAQTDELCDHCHVAFASHDFIAYDRDENRAWHMDIRQPGGTCRFLHLRGTKA